MIERPPYIKTKKDLLNKIEMQERAIKVLNDNLKKQREEIRKLKQKLSDTNQILKRYKKRLLEGEKNERK